MSKMPRPDYIDCRLRITGHNRATLEFEGESYSGKPNLDPGILRPLLLESETDQKQLLKQISAH